MKLIMLSVAFEIASRIAFAQGTSDPMAQLPSNTAMSNGVAHLVVRLSTGGFQQLTASNVTSPAMPTSTTQVRAISSGFHLEAEGYPTTLAAHRLARKLNVVTPIIDEVHAVLYEGKLVGNALKDLIGRESKAEA